MMLSGPQLKQLHEALISAYPNPRALDMMVRYVFNKNLSALTRSGSLEHIVFELLQWAEAQGRLEELIQGAHAYNPGNPQLARVAQLLEANPNWPAPPGTPAPTSPHEWNQLPPQSKGNPHENGPRQRGQRVDTDPPYGRNQIHIEGNVGGDIAGHNINKNNYIITHESGAKYTAKARMVITMLVLFFLWGLISAGASWFTSHPLNIHLPGFDTGLSSTPDNALKQFCQNLVSGNVQGAYDDFSWYLKNTYSLDQFTTDWTGNKIPQHCTETISIGGTSSASGTLVMAYTRMNNDGSNTKTVSYDVTLASDNGIWQIDTWQQAWS